jgi:ribosome biogenesis protein Nip4
MTSPIIKFASQVNAKLTLYANSIVEKTGRYFLLNEALLKIAGKDFYYAGIYLGKIKKGKFFPSFNLLTMLIKGEANKIVVDKKAAWLFICGRDIFWQGILAVHGSHKKGGHALVLNQFGECLGFGRIVSRLDVAAANEVVIKNISDVGDFLRREA